MLPKKQTNEAFLFFFFYQPWMSVLLSTDNTPPLSPSLSHLDSANNGTFNPMKSGKNIFDLTAMYIKCTSHENGGD